jgi:hypothetical protein
MAHPPDGAQTLPGKGAACKLFPRRAFASKNVRVQAQRWRQSDAQGQELLSCHI